MISASAPGVTPPVALATVSPLYPELARRAHVEGGARPVAVFLSVAVTFELKNL